jgi:hypothetical protein
MNLSEEDPLDQKFLITPQINFDANSRRFDVLGLPLNLHSNKSHHILNSKSANLEKP